MIFSQVDILHLLIYFDVKKWHIRQNMSFSSKKKIIALSSLCFSLLGNYEFESVIY